MKRLAPIALLAIALAGCTETDLDALLECNSNEFARSEVAVVRLGNAQAAAEEAFEIALGSIDDVGADGAAIFAIVDGRAVAAAEPIRNGDAYDVTELLVCRPR